MAEKKTTAKTAPAPAVETVENPVNKMIDGLVEKAQAALKEFLTLDQEQIDHIVHEMALAGLDKHQELARMAVEETGRGVYEDKVIKNMFATTSKRKRPWACWTRTRWRAMWKWPSL